MRTTIILLFLFLSQTLCAEEPAPVQPGVELPMNIQPEKQEEEAQESEAVRQESLKKFFEDWTIYMKGFDPMDMINIEIPAGEKMVFFESIDRAPQLLRGAYSVSAKTKNKVLFTIYDPLGNVVVVKDRQRESIFYTQINITGEYVFVFYNQNVLSIIPHPK